jgi:hypothetical protein
MSKLFEKKCLPDAKETEARGIMYDSQHLRQAGWIFSAKDVT